MSHLFGNPPPPPTQIFEPRPGAQVQEEEWFYVPEPDPGRRRAAVVIAFFAVGLLLFANIATWLHFSGVRAKQAPVVAAATFDSVAQSASVTLIGAGTRAIAPDSAIDTTGTSGTNLADPRIKTDVAEAVGTALADPTLERQWTAAVEEALALQQGMLDGSVESGDQIVLRLDLDSVSAQVLDLLTDKGYTPDADALVVSAYELPVNASPGGVTSVLGSMQSLWWLLWALAIGLGAAAIAVATRRLRLAAIMAVDAVVMLAGCLLLVPLVRQVADNQAIDSTQAAIVQSGFDALVKTLVSQTLTLMVVAACAAVVLGLMARSRGRAQAVRDRA